MQKKFSKLNKVTHLSTKERSDRNRLFEKTLQDIAADYRNVYSTMRSWYNPDVSKLKTYQQFQTKEQLFKHDFVFCIVEGYQQYKINNQQNKAVNGKDDELKQAIRMSILKRLFEDDLDFMAREYIELYNGFRDSSERFSNWPVVSLTQQLDRQVKNAPLDHELKVFLESMLSWKLLHDKSVYYGCDVNKARSIIANILYTHDEKYGSHLPYHWPKDELGEFINRDLSKISSSEKDHWYGLFHIFEKVKSSKPPKNFESFTNALMDQIGLKNYKERAHRWIDFISVLKEKSVLHQSLHEGRIVNEWTTYEFLHDKNKVLLKGMIWSMNRFHDRSTLSKVSNLAIKSFEKIPGVGPRAAAIGNACIYMLGHSKGLEGISQLARLKQKVTQANTKKLIDKYLTEASEKRGISLAEIEEISVPDFGLTAGIKNYIFEDYTLRIQIEDIRKISQTWIKPNGNHQKSAPAFIKRSNALSKKLKKAKEEVKAIKKYVSAQKDRIDRLFIQDRRINTEQFRTYYFDHGLVNCITRNLIWEFEIGDNFKAHYFNGSQWSTLNGETLDSIEKMKIVRLWHPIHSEPEEVKAWRALFDNLKIKQPIKQVYREIYLLTDAETQTRNYSNRMAAHILKQHQFKALANIRGWQYSLMGAYDDGRDDEIAKLPLRQYHLEAQYWINQIYDDQAMNDAGIWHYVTTDQLRFVNEDGQLVDLIDIPPLVLSEVMRDADLFVGVSSVGNDPEWRDGGALTRHQNYWTSYAFGALAEIAKTRKTILEGLIPKLNIRDRAKIEGNFLNIKGTIRTYKIHMGSTNILMEPNDQYLCIVPSRSTGKNLNNVFLPFDGDRALSIILSKAFLLAADDKISDPSITRQIRVK